MKIVLYSFCLLAATLSACSSVKKSGAKTGSVALAESTTEYLCNRTVKYFFEKTIITTETGVEREDNTAFELILNPDDGQVQMKANPEKTDQTKKGDLKLKTCNLAAGMISGEAVYELMDEDQIENGNTVINTITMKLEASNGTVSISLFHPGKPGSMKMVTQQWEVMK